MELFSYSSSHSILKKKKLKNFNFKIIIKFEENLPFFPEWLAKMVADLGLDAALDMTELFTRSYTAPHFYDEMKGLADATGADYQSTKKKKIIFLFLNF